MTDTDAVRSVKMENFIRIELTSTFENKSFDLVKEGDINPLKTMPRTLDMNAYKNNTPKILAVFCSDFINHLKGSWLYKNNLY